MLWVDIEGLAYSATGAIGHATQAAADTCLKTLSGLVAAVSEELDLLPSECGSHAYGGLVVGVS